MTSLKRTREELEIEKLENDVAYLTLDDMRRKRANLSTNCNFKVTSNELCGKLCKNLCELKSHIKIHYNSNEYSLIKLFKFNNIIFQRNLLIPRIETGKFFVDFVISRPTHTFIIECDRKQNKDVDFLTETTRMEQAQLNLNLSVPVVWIRYNADIFHVDTFRRSKFVLRLDREKRLLNVLQTFNPTQKTTVIYMYYDCCTVNGELRLKILEESEYKEFAKKYVVDLIID